MKGLRPGPTCELIFFLNDFDSLQHCASKCYQGEYFTERNYIMY